MRTITHKFDTVAVKATKRWVDKEGKKRQVTKTFFQTLNPFNRKSDGTIKDRSDIMAEITAERDAWMANNSLRK
ncbi:hypothetical protein Xoosp13_326 [Xanthomonas phage Xoo-sp13]|nr:hypothetical protein Xoosp13_326 [Xanthomonas phage Xoo-sp13]